MLARCSMYMSVLWWRTMYMYLEEGVLGVLVLAGHDGTHSPCGVPGGECSRRPGTGRT
jgi:hypothetical protein